MSPGRYAAARGGTDEQRMRRRAGRRPRRVELVLRRAAMVGAQQSPELGVGAVETGTHEWRWVGFGVSSDQARLVGLCLTNRAWPSQFGPSKF